MIGTLTHNNNQWIVRQTQTVKNCFGCKSYQIFNDTPIHPKDIDDKLFDIEKGMQVEFYIIEECPHYDGQHMGKDCNCKSGLIKYARISLNPWDDFFQKSEEILHEELPQRYKNWLMNTYNLPQKK